MAVLDVDVVSTGSDKREDARNSSLMIARKAMYNPDKPSPGNSYNSLTFLSDRIC
jgi:hypothetical protein